MGFSWCDFQKWMHVFDCINRSSCCAYVFVATVSWEQSRTFLSTVRSLRCWVLNHNVLRKTACASRRNRHYCDCDMLFHVFNSSGTCAECNQWIVCHVKHCHPTVATINTLPLIKWTNSISPSWAKIWLT